ncbi:branched-chain amino acid transport system II carrier protein [Bacillaceae bacterium SIJ1]|nr:branched-chain amino acid transport system II carrier protein [Litoribacterium kuwaitense]
MLFALFFGAGNLIFPPLLGQLAGEAVWSANAGFLTTGVGLPLLGVIALGISGKSDVLALTERVHPWFALAFTTVLYLAIGPLFAMPRTGNTSYEIAIHPFIGDAFGPWPLLLFSIAYFSITCFLALNPKRLVDWVGRLLSPLLLIFIAVLVTVVLMSSTGQPQAPADSYATMPFFRGFQEGYLTLDALAAFVFGIIVVQAIRQRGFTTKSSILKASLIAASLAAIMLALVYSSLSLIGATSMEMIGPMENGGRILVALSQSYLGVLGSILLGLVVTFACMTTSIGLTSACSIYFHKLFPALPYRTIAVSLSIFSAVFANIGLTQLIAISVPVLQTIYPLAIVMIVLTFVHAAVPLRPEVYQGAMFFTFLISLFDGLKAAGVPIAEVQSFFNSILPLYSAGMGWILPAIIGGILGTFAAFTRKPQTHAER